LDTEVKTLKGTNEKDFWLSLFGIERDLLVVIDPTVGKIGDEQLFYLMSRGLNENEATNMIVLGFLEMFTKELPMEYAVEFNRLIKLEMEGALG